MSNITLNFQINLLIFFLYKKKHKKIMTKEGHNFFTQQIIFTK